MYSNLIQSNDWYGICLQDSSNNNTIYLNNFIGNTNQLYLTSSSSGNRFYSPKPIEYIYMGKTYTNYTGNYWSDYNGTDSNGDGIGDQPYGPDRYPLVGIVKLENGQTIITPLLTITIINPQNGILINQTTITIEWNAIAPEGDINHYELYADGSPVNTSIPPEQNSYTLTLTEGTHTITVRAVDSAGNTAEDTIEITIIVETTGEGGPSAFPYFVIGIVVIIAALFVAIVAFRRRSR